MTTGNIPYGEVADHARDGIMNVMLDGDRRGKSGWLEQSVFVHVYHAITHLGNYLMGDTTEDHLNNAQTRIAMARILIEKQNRQ